MKPREFEAYYDHVFYSDYLKLKVDYELLEQEATENIKKLTLIRCLGDELKIEIQNQLGKGKLYENLHKTISNTETDLESYLHVLRTYIRAVHHITMEDKK